jgi:hypothetical protein
MDLVYKGYSPQTYPFHVLHFEVPKKLTGLAFGPIYHLAPFSTFLNHVKGGAAICLDQTECLLQAARPCSIGHLSKHNKEGKPPFAPLFAPLPAPLLTPRYSLNGMVSKEPVHLIAPEVLR